MLIPRSDASNDFLATARALRQQRSRLPRARGIIRGSWLVLGRSVEARSPSPSPGDDTCVACTASGRVLPSFMMNCVNTRFSLLTVVLALCGPAAGAGAQSLGTRPATDRTRAQLEASARVADSAHRTEEAFLLRSRLREGDFEDGDRIIIAYDGIGLQRGDTLVVQTSKLLRLGEPMGDMNLRGVLRSEIVDSVSARVSKYFRNVAVHATPLVRVSVSGAVRAPGFYYARADMPVSDVIMRSGGQDQTSDLGKTVIKRGSVILWTADDVRTALRDGVTLEGLGLIPGDEIVVGVRSTSDVWPRVLQFGLPLVSALLLQLALRR